MPHLVHLPADVLALVVRTLQWGDWARLACVSRAFRDVVGDARAACSHADASTLQLSYVYRCYSISWHVLRWPHGLLSLVLSGVLDFDVMTFSSVVFLFLNNSIRYILPQQRSRPVASAACGRCNLCASLTSHSDP